MKQTIQITVQKKKNYRRKGFLISRLLLVCLKIIDDNADMKKNVSTKADILSFESIENG